MASLTNPSSASTFIFSNVSTTGDIHASIVSVVDTLIIPIGANGKPSIAFSGDTDTGFYRTSTAGVPAIQCNGAPVVAFAASSSHGQLRAVGPGSALFPHYAFNSEASLGLYRSGAATVSLVAANSAASFNLNQSRLLSIRTLAASAITVSAGNTNVRVDELVLTIGGDSGASLAIHSGGTIYIFNSALSAKAT